MLGVLVKVYVRDTSEVQESLVNRIDLDTWRILLQYPADSLRHIAIKSHIAGEYCDIVLLDNISYFEKRITHLNAECLCLVTSGNSAAIIVR